MRGRTLIIFVLVASLHMSYGQKAVNTPLVQVQIPDVEVINQDGRAVKFDSDVIGDRLTVINTIFTTCTTICPVAGTNFGYLAKKLGDRLGSDMILVSISIDPMNDTPERLKNWKAKFYAGNGWTLLTGSKPEVDRLLKALGLFAPERQDHTSTVLIGSRKAGWTRANSLASPSKLLEVIERFTANPENSNSEKTLAAGRQGKNRS